MEIQEWLKILTCPKLTFKIFAIIKDELKALSRLTNLPENKVIATTLTEQQLNYLRAPLNSRCEEALWWITSNNVELVSYFDDRYPHLLKEIDQPPMALFCLGDINYFNNVQLGVVGSRSPSRYGIDKTEEIVEELVAAGITITSGLAVGIDGIAHRSALKYDGNTIAILGSGFSHLYPKRHYQLAMDIINAGLLVSEFLPNEPPKKQNFPRRNRIISGLSNGVLVTEAAIKSGSLITAYHALEQGRDVFALPGSVNNKLSAGPHHLIKQGAKLVASGADILEEYEMLCTQVHISRNQKNYLADTNLLASVDHDMTPIDMIIQRSGLPIEQVLTELLNFEIEGLVAAVPGGYIKLV